MSAVVAPLPSLRAFRPARRINSRLFVAGGLAVLSVLALLVGLSVVVPESQVVLQAARDVPAGATIQASDVTAVRVRVPDSMLAAAFPGRAADELIGRRAAVRISAGEMLTPRQFAARHVSVPPGRVQSTVPVDAYTASAGALGSGDLVVVYATPRQTTSLQTASVLVEQARVITVGRADQSGSPASGAANGKLLWVTLDVSQDEAARLEGATRSAFVGLALLGGGGAASANE